MPNDPITTTPAAPAPAGGGTPAAPTAAPSGISRDEFADFQEKLIGAVQAHAQNVDQRINQWGQRLQTAPGQPGGRPAAPGTPAAPAPDPDGLLMQIASGDLSGIDARVIKQLQDTGLIGHLSRQAQNAAATNEASARAAVDTEFGEGTFDKQLKPLVDSLLGDSVTARSDPATFHNALAAAKGQRFNDLVTARTGREKAASDAAAAAEATRRASAPWMPGNGWAPSAPNTLDEDDAGRLRRIGEQTGGNIPKAEEAAKVRDLMWRKGVDGVSMEDLGTIFTAPRT